jgi:hypothetical protein
MLVEFVATDGDVLVVGAPCTDSYTGVVHVYKKNETAGIWELTATLTEMMVQRESYDDSLIGSVYMFQKKNECGYWTQITKITAKDGKHDDVFGVSVGISDDAIFIGTLTVAMAWCILSSNPIEHNPSLQISFFML